jgi:hypothetical protein
LGSQLDNGGAQAGRRRIVRRHASLRTTRLRDCRATGADTKLQCGRAVTVAFDDANGAATEVFVNCNEGGTITHGTVSSSNVGVSQNLGSTPGSPYTVSVTATFTIDLSITTGLKRLVNQGSFTFTAAFSGNMQAAANGGVEPGLPNRVQISMIGASLLTTNGTSRGQLSNFSMSVDDNDTLGRTTISGGYTYASTIIGGSVTVNISQPIVYQPQGALHANSGAVTITSSGSLGKIVLTVISSVAGVRVDVYADASGPVTDTANLSWATVDAL